MVGTNNGATGSPGRLTGWRTGVSGETAKRGRGEVGAHGARAGGSGEQRALGVGRADEGRPAWAASASCGVELGVAVGVYVEHPTAGQNTRGGSTRQTESDRLKLCLPPPPAPLLNAIALLLLRQQPSGTLQQTGVTMVVVTAANVADVTKTRNLLHSEEKQVHANDSYTGVEKREEIVALGRKIDWQIAAKRGTIKTIADGVQKEELKAVDKKDIPRFF